jgi:hypothetical protein
MLGLVAEFRAGKGPTPGAYSSMAKKRGYVWDGIRDAHHVHQVIEALGTLRQSGGRALEDLGGMAMMIAPLGVIVVLFWLLK